MNNPGMQAFCAGLSDLIAPSDVTAEVLRHEMWSSMNRRRLTGLGEGLQGLNTEQLAGSVIANSTAVQANHPFFIGLLCSAAIDGRMDVVELARRNGVCPDWDWLEWAPAFTGSEQELAARLQETKEARFWSAAVCVAARSCPQAIGLGIMRSCLNGEMAMVFHRLCEAVFTSNHGGRIVDAVIDMLMQKPMVLMAGDADLLLSRLVANLAENRLDRDWGDLRRAFGDRARIAYARRYMVAGDAKKAWSWIQDIRLLSPWYDEAAMVACLCHLEQGDVESAEKMAVNITDAIERLRIQVRIAQVHGNAFTEAGHLERLHELQPENGPTFLSLLSALHRCGDHAKLQKLALGNRERYADDEETATLIDRLLALVA